MGACLGKSSTSHSNSRPGRHPSKKEKPSPLTLTRDESTQEGTDFQPRQRKSQDQVVPHSVLLSLTSVQLYNDPSPPECPYCGKPGNDKADMMICKSETIPYDMFELLMERGWWRTGNIIFRPQQENICCPSFAIRSPVSEYKLTKNHRRVLNRWKDFLINGDPRWENRMKTSSAATKTEIGLNSLEEPNHSTSNSINRVMPTGDGLHPNDSTTHLQAHASEGACKKNKIAKKVRPGVGPDPNKPPCIKAKERRRKKKEGEGNPVNNNDDSSNKNRGAASHNNLPLLEIMKAHEEEISCGNPKHKLEIRLVASDDKEMKDSLVDFFSLYNRFQDGVHPGKSKFKTSADLHWAFINSPLRPSDRSKGDRPMGTYHMRYYLDGELIMLSVIDILPTYLVSIYFIYDPDIRFLQPGIYTCLREIALIQELQRESPELVYYNLGFYNDFSQKINYKRQFKPTEILCPITSTYVPLDTALPLLRDVRYCRLADREVPQKPEKEDLDVNDVVVLDVVTMQGQYLKDNSILRMMYGPIVQHYMWGAGRDIMTRMLISR
ncbi:PREDICTED: arginyl-tRNA--protein transferase 1-like [Amphimedon queenslandica]|uniref:Arginyl-tRNA--protein transferase 1 n=1 Tax=Amphimedon queenslandica TaxID=400682 RepID=A0A1X7U2T0_AMPQE|nr:PREDICTED: arginyl-tRNA--protein transferase 1-like [Amphimedon queenslandica]|eukprot:XP_003389194.1 PREDICTED: arginyl-tRNA--protein transferase 1-like [Amphimedon queenslandica]